MLLHLGSSGVEWTCGVADGEALESLRRYEIATVRRRGAGRGAPGAHLAADLDIVCPRFSSPTETALPEAESILVSPGDGGQSRLSSVKLLRAVLEYLTPSCTFGVSNSGKGFNPPDRDYLICSDFSACSYQN